MANEKQTTTVYERLSAVQQELEAPKGRYNSFGKYKYRSCEDILESVKPLLAKHDLVMTLQDEVVIPADGQAYIKATVNVMDPSGDNVNRNVETSAYAMIDKDKKGMDAPQQTGTASSYARKYALNGMFLIDDTKDSDTDEHKNETNARTKNTGNAAAASKTSGLASEQEIRDFQVYLETEGIDEAYICESCKIQNLTMITSKLIAGYSDPKNLETLKTKYAAWKEKKEAK